VDKRSESVGHLKRLFEAQLYGADEMRRMQSLMGFDQKFYLERYPDVAAARVDPFIHFIQFGIDEGRLPCVTEGPPDRPTMKELLGFDAKFYQQTYPDIKEAPFEHFLAYGMRERRFPFDLIENLQAESLAKESIDAAEVDHPIILEEQWQFESEAWKSVIDDIEDLALQELVAPKRYRNNFWLALAIGFLTQGRLGCAACCYNFYFNYYIPLMCLQNFCEGFVRTGKVFSTVEVLAREKGIIARGQVTGTIEVREPHFLNRRREAGGVVKIGFQAPLYGMLKNVEVIAGTSLIVRDGHTVIYDYIENGGRPRELQCPNVMHVAGDYCSYRSPNKVLKVEEAFSFFHDHGHNYHHWLLEILPRYLFARQNGLQGDVPILIESRIAPQLLEILRLILKGSTRLIKVELGVSAQVQRLHWASDLCLNKVHTMCEPAPDDIVISPTAVSMLRKIAEPFFVTKQNKYENVFIARNNVEFRRLINGQVLQSALTDAGFLTFDPGASSWTEQVRVFSNAKLIVTEAGSALANLIFCQPGANVIVLVNGHRNSNYFYLNQLSSLVNVRLFLFECFRLTGSHIIDVQADMIVRVGDLMSWVKLFMSDPNLEIPRSSPMQSLPISTRQ
jgi:Glycosyltransferase 61